MVRITAHYIIFVHAVLFTFTIYRGETFCHVYSHLGEVCSLIPSNVRVMAVTATASREATRTITKTLAMKPLHTISVTPSKPNISYVVVHKDSMRELVSQIAVKLKEKELCRTIVYCNRSKDVYEMYSLFGRARCKLY